MIKKICHRCREWIICEHLQNASGRNVKVVLLPYGVGIGTVWINSSLSRLCSIHYFISFSLDEICNSIRTRPSSCSASLMNSHPLDAHCKRDPCPSSKCYTCRISSPFWPLFLTWLKDSLSHTTPNKPFAIGYEKCAIWNMERCAMSRWRWWRRGKELGEMQAGGIERKICMEDGGGKAGYITGVFTWSWRTECSCHSVVGHGAECEVLFFQFACGLTLAGGRGQTIWYRHWKGDLKWPAGPGE